VLGDLVARIVREPRKSHPSHMLMGGEPFGEDLRACLRLGEPQWQGSQAA
jgi:hypothetical protein